MTTDLARRMKVASIDIPHSTRYLPGDYMREDPMYSAREVREFIYAEREACAKWYKEKGWLLDEEDVADAMLKRDEVDRS